MTTVCCVCSGRHHPLNCPTALRSLDQCAEPTPDDYVAVQPATATSRLVLAIDLTARRPRRSTVDPLTSSTRRAIRHQRAARARYIA